MPIYTSTSPYPSKFAVGQALPEHATSLVFNAVEPLITPAQLSTDHLFGVPLISTAKDPLTGRRAVMTPDILKRIIERAVAIVEQETHTDIAPKQFTEKHPYDRALYESFGYMQLNHRPVSSVDELTVTPSNGIMIYKFPTDWIEPAHLQRGQLNMVPLGIAINSGGAVPVQATGGAPFVSIMGYGNWLPSFWQVLYTAGYIDMMVPRIVNELIGVVAAMEVLAMLAATQVASSWSLGIDGQSQSVSTPGPQVYDVRLKTLGEKRMQLVGQLRAIFGTKLFSSNV